MQWKAAPQTLAPQTLPAIRTGMLRRHVIAHGRVQGVFFRDSTARRADELGVAGWVRNQADGTVEAVFEGDDEAVEGMVRFCRQGPGHAHVSELEVINESPEGLSGFQVR